MIYKNGTNKIIENAMNQLQSAIEMRDYTLDRLAVNEIGQEFALKTLNYAKEQMARAYNYRIEYFGLIGADVRDLEAEKSEALRDFDVKIHSVSGGMKQ